MLRCVTKMRNSGEIVRRRARRGKKEKGKKKQKKGGGTIREQTCNSFPKASYKLTTILYLHSFDSIFLPCFSGEFFSSSSKKEKKKKLN